MTPDVTPDIPSTSSGPASGNAREQIRAHVAQHLGAIGHVFHEPAFEGLAIDILHVPAAIDRPLQTLVTAGVSDRAMPVSDNARAPRHLELMMTLPERWKLDDASNADPRWYWPVRALGHLARFAHSQRTGLGWGQTIPNGDPPAAFAPDTALCGVILAPSLLVPKEFYELKAGTRRIEFYSAIPLYKEEMDLRQSQGMEHLLSTLIDHGINDLVDPKRRNVTKKRFGFF